jgi:hypothetical protein
MRLVEATFEQDRKSLVDSIAIACNETTAAWNMWNEANVHFDFSMTPEQKELYSNSIYKAKA